MSGKKIIEGLEEAIAFQKAQREKIDALKSPRGGWTREALATLGISWPPQKGWRKKLIYGAQAEERVLAIRGSHDAPGFDACLDAEIEKIYREEALESGLIPVDNPIFVSQGGQHSVFPGGQISSLYASALRDNKKLKAILEQFPSHRIPVNMLRPEELIESLDEDTLMAIVMRLTSGFANPSTVKQNIKRLKSTAQKIDNLNDGEK